MNRLKTYLQISDLHFAGPLQRSAVDPWWRYVPCLKGYVGHSQGALGYLTNAFKKLRKAEPDAELIITGDLTAWGTTSEFQQADGFLTTAGQRPSFLGLNAPDRRTFAIPGNHDHWPGIPFWPLGTPNSEVRRRFPNDWAVTPSTMLPNSVSVVFLSLNSDADVGGYSAERVWARGSFVSAVNGLDEELTNHRQERHEIRVLLLHHSVEYEGRRIRRSSTRRLPLGVSIGLEYLTIDNASRQRVADLLDKHGIRVVLTGHIHQPFFVGQLPKSSLYPKRDVMEARCGSTSQRLTAALGTGNEGGSNAPCYQNSLIVHRLLEDAGRIYWQSEVHTVFRLQGGFQPASNFLDDPPSQGQILVWP